MSSQDWVALLDGLEESVAILGLDGSIRQVNAAFQSLVGLSSNDLPASVSFDWFLLDRREMPSIAELAASTKKFWSGDVQLSRVNGSDCAARCRVQPMRDADGRTQGFAVVLKEATDQRVHAERLRMFELAVAQSLEPVLITEAEPIDVPGPRIVYANKAFTRVTGYTLEEVLGKTPRILQGPKSDRSELDRVRAALQAWRPVRAELLNYRKDGTEFWVELVIFPVADENGWFTHWVAVQREITNRKSLEITLKNAKEEAERANLAKTSFLANMSHEIRTPLAAILGFSEMLLNGEPTTSDRDKIVRSIQSNGTHLLEIVGNVLDLSRIEADKYRVELHRCSPVRLVEDVISSQNLVAREKGISLSFEVDATVPEACITDAASVRQILTNLVSNALKFTPSYGHVHVVVRGVRTDVPDDGLHLEFEVSDDGIGIEESEIERLFQPFEQADNTTSRKYGGAGLGLNICRGLTKLLGGTITATSTPGKGSTFRLRIPILSDSDSRTGSGTLGTLPKPTADRGLSAAPPHFQGRILVVDDSPDNRKIISYYLKSTGLAVDLAENGREAIRIALESDHRAILMDMQMPEIDGYTAVTELRKLGYARPIIALTAHALSEDRQRCLAAGCTDYLTKPVRMRDLHTVLLNHLKEDAAQELPSAEL